MTGSHEPLSVAVEDGEVVVSVFNIDTYDSARVRLAPESARDHARELLAAATDLTGEEDGSGTEEGGDASGSAGSARSQMGVPPGGPSTTPFRA